MPDSITLSTELLTQFGERLFCAAGVLENEAATVSESLVAADLRGHASHGVVRIPDYVRQLEKGELVADVDLDISSETASLIVADAQFGFGQVQMRQLINRLDPKARQQGIACGTLKNCGHVGRLGEWAERVAESGLAGLVAVNDNGVLKCVSPPGGTSPRISTNPIALGIPTGEFPLVLDISTSAVANGKIKVVHLSGQDCPPGWLQDASGHPTTNPAVRFTDPRGTILPMGGEQGYKGFGLGLFFDMLVGGLSGGHCPPAPDGTPGTNNVLLLIWDPAKFSGAEHFVNQIDGLQNFVRGTPLKEENKPIRLPGDRSRALLAERMSDGIPLEIGTWNALTSLANASEVPLPAV